MKKVFAIMISLCLVIALFAACAKKPDTPVPTEAPQQATEAPVDQPTDAPTEAPTEAPTPEPTPEPFIDPYKVEIGDWDDAEVRAMSFDTIFFDKKTITDGKVDAWKSDNDETIDGTNGKIKVVGMRGWAGFLEEDMVAMGYRIDNREPVFVENPFEATQPEVKAAGGDYAQRFRVNIPVEGLYGNEHELRVFAKLESGACYYINPEGPGFLLYYNGPEAVENKIDGKISDGEYNTSYILDSSNAVTWTNSEIGDLSVKYYLRLAADAVYVGFDAAGFVEGDSVQLNFNPGARLDESSAGGLFVSLVIGENAKVLQHNHKTQLKDEIDTAGTDITDLVEAKIVTTDTGYAGEVKLPADFFKVTDVEKAADFTLGSENLYFGMFVVIINGPDGFTNQSAAPGSDWSPKALGLHEHVVY